MQSSLKSIRIHEIDTGAVEKKTIVSRKGLGAQISKMNAEENTLNKTH